MLLSLVQGMQKKKKKKFILILLTQFGFLRAAEKGFEVKVVRLWGLLNLTTQFWVFEKVWLWIGARCRNLGECGLGFGFRKFGFLGLWEIWRIWVF